MWLSCSNMRGQDKGLVIEGIWIKRYVILKKKKKNAFDVYKKFIGIVLFFGIYSNYLLEIRHDYWSSPYKLFVGSITSLAILFASNVKIAIKWTIKYSFD